MITQNIIGFQLRSSSGKQIYAADPALLTTLPEGFYTATIEEVDDAVRKAHSAWRDYRHVAGSRRAAFLNAIADGIEQLGDQLVKRIIQETAYPESRVLVERARTCAQLRMFADIALQDKWRVVSFDKALPDRTPAPRPELRKMKIPIGPVVVFGASNFPLAYSTAGGDVASALAVGCPVIVKAHDSHLGTNALVAEVIMQSAIETGMPDGVFSSLNGDGMETGRQLVMHPLTAAVGFTGSQKGGRALFDLGCQRERPIPVFAEMGSVNPIFLLPGKVDDDPARLAGQLAASMTMTVGQFCTNPGILVALKSESTSQLILHVKTALEKVDALPMLNQNISASFHKGVAEVKADPEVTLVTQGRGESHLASPVLTIADAMLFFKRPALHHEIFGPYSILLLCEDIEQMQSVAAVLEGQLTAAVFGLEEELHGAKELLEILIEKAGRIIINGVPTGVEVCESMTHGGPYPASTDSRFTAVGHHALERWIRPVTFQNWPWVLLPKPLIA